MALSRLLFVKSSLFLIFSSNNQVTFLLIMCLLTLFCRLLVDNLWGFPIPNFFALEMSIFFSDFFDVRIHLYIGATKNVQKFLKIFSVFSWFYCILWYLIFGYLPDLRFLVVFIDFYERQRRRKKYIYIYI